MGRSEKLKFYDVKARKSFTSSDYKIVKFRTKKGTFEVARAKSPFTGKPCYRILRRLK
ncbi:MAG: hypothetical protein QW607_07235 [Desulfurococcaceae archaeon]